MSAAVVASVQHSASTAAGQVQQSSTHANRPANEKSPQPPYDGGASSIIRSEKGNIINIGNSEARMQNGEFVRSNEVVSEVAPESYRLAYSHGSNDPLTPELRKILQEVAQTGGSTILPWACSSSISDTQLPRRPETSLTGSSPHSHSIHRRPTGTAPLYMGGSSAAALPSSSSISGQAPRTIYRNGVHQQHVHRRRQDSAAASAGRRKRPRILPLAGSAASSSANSSTNLLSLPGSASSISGGNGPTSGSEPDDSTLQYECDSEGTSATTNSDFSFDKWGDHRLRKRRVEMQNSMALQSSVTAVVEEQIITAEYTCVRDAFRDAIGLVLDHWFANRGGYALAAAERQRHVAALGIQSYSKQRSLEKLDKVDDMAPINGSKELSPVQISFSNAISADDIFRHRRQKLLSALDNDSAGTTTASSGNQPKPDHFPPFTIQRIAEVLIEPERYYTQLHKLCNCLEKLLLVTSSTAAFGGSTGGNTLQSRRETLELAALAEEHRRLQSEMRHQRLKRRASSSLSDENNLELLDGQHARPSSMEIPDPRKETLDQDVSDDNNGSMNTEDAASRELEAAARASLRTKFDHVGIDPHSSTVGNRDILAIAESRSMTNSPPPPSLALSSGGSPIMLRHHHDQDHGLALGRPPSPIMFNSNAEGGSSPPMGSLHSFSSAQVLKMNQAMIMAGLSPSDMLSLHASVQESGSASLLTAGYSGLNAASRDGDLESRSSASSDFDSESDVSFDDSASDRSDGSDSGIYEPFSTARAIALNRLQQQRLQQGRLMTSLYQQSETGQAQIDSDSFGARIVDMARADDSAGSDSSSSEAAD